MRIVDSPEQMRALADQWVGDGLRIGFVPTMGYLHDGHTSLMERLRPEVDRLVVSVYVNPLQFGASEDLSRYPRDPEGDTAKCKSAGADVLFMPVDLYPSGFVTSVHVDRLTDHLCGPLRPGHFEGVATVCARLFGLVRPHVAIFGEKDWQQLQVLRRMVRDLALPVHIVAGDLQRAADGVALSSRNAYLSPGERRRAASIPRALLAMRHAVDAGVRDRSSLLTIATPMLDVDRLQYLDIVHAEDLTPLERVDGPARVAIAAYIGRTRLIDNVDLTP